MFHLRHEQCLSRDRAIGISWSWCMSKSREDIAGFGGIATIAFVRPHALENRSLKNKKEGGKQNVACWT